ncbi:MAG: DUF485 domain-containing protein [Candidatus Manganitrophus sp.]|nr:MAG: DUF485 domain-containing protein [Candidatus Manganitrophus sp.]
MAGKKKKSTSKDLTPKVGAATDIAPVGRGKIKPPHERTADEEADVVDWEKVAAMAEFKALLAAKRKFILPTTIFFVAYYFALPILVGYAPGLMKTQSHRRGQPGLSLRPVPVFHGLDCRGALHAGGGAVRWDDRER